MNGCWDSQGEFSKSNVDRTRLRDKLAEYVDTYAPGGDFVFSAMVGRMGDDSPEANEAREIVKQFYYDYARDKVPH